MAAVTPARIGATGTAERTWQASGALDRLAWTSLSELLPAGARLVVVAPHPDDEVLGCGGLLALAAAAGHPSCVVAVTDGEAARGRPALPGDTGLGALRAAESARALRLLGDPALLRLHLPDGGVGRAAVRRALEPLCTGRDVVATTWRGDGHPDHEETGHGVAALGLPLLEVGVWLWHWASPGDPAVPWERMRRLALPAAVLAAKRDALDCFPSQLRPDPCSGAPAVVPAELVAAHTRPFETVLVP
jgi:LmbE family N-acetylglucosaminyl deacetylase